MFHRPLPAPARDIALLIGRLVLGVVLFAHGWQKLMINGISGTYGQFEKLGIPLAIVSASFTAFVEFVGGVLLIVGALTTTVIALDLVVMVGAAGFVHITHGIFAADGGWELVGVIAAVELALAATGPGRYSVDHLISTHRSEQDATPAKVPVAVDGAEAAGAGLFAALDPRPDQCAPRGPRYGCTSQVIGRARVLERWLAAQPPITTALRIIPARARTESPDDRRAAVTEAFVQVGRTAGVPNGGLSSPQASAGHPQPATPLPASGLPKRIARSPRARIAAIPLK
jgi:putative oxidoreductase